LEAAREAAAAPPLPDPGSPPSAQPAEPDRLTVLVTPVDPPAARPSAEPTPNADAQPDPPTRALAPSSTADGKDTPAAPASDPQAAHAATPSTSVEAKPKAAQDETPAEPAEESPARADEGLAPATAAAPATKRPAPLEITELRLCRKVINFGVFEPMDLTAVKAGQRLLVYCELTGLDYEPRGQLFISRLASHIELRNGSDESIVWEQSPEVGEDTCRRPRRDYYVNYRIELPSTLEPGPYRLRLIQTDLIADRTTSKDVPIAIAP
jgi:hypothetical protein